LSDESLMFRWIIFLTSVAAGFVLAVIVGYGP
jgi:hypothetical protein